LETKNTCSQWVGWNMHSKCLDFIFLKFWVGGMGGGFFSFFLCSQDVLFCSLQVPNGFPICSLSFQCFSPRVFPIAPRFNPICFAQSPPLLTYRPIKITHCKKKVGLVRHPQLIDSTHTIVGKWQCLLLNTLGGRNLGGLNKILGFATSPYRTPSPIPSYQL
jgi:hypothetical protein